MPTPIQVIHLAGHHGPRCRRRRAHDHNPWSVARGFRLHVCDICSNVPTMIENLPRRERELLEVLCGLGEATAEQLRAAMSAPPSNSAMRTFLARMERRGAVMHRVEGNAYVYRPVAAPRSIAREQLRHIVQTHFGGSIAQAASMLLGDATRVEPAELDAIEALIQSAREKK